MKETEENYPNIELNIEIKVKRLPTAKWAYVGILHVKGPDDFFEFESGHYITKKFATEEMLKNYQKVVDNLFNQIEDL